MTTLKIFVDPVPDDVVEAGLCEPGFMAGLRGAVDFEPHYTTAQATRELAIVRALIACAAALAEAKIDGIEVYENHGLFCEPPLLLYSSQIT